jgi:hypothetical protein
MLRFFVILVIAMCSYNYLICQTLFDNYQYKLDLIYDSINRQFSGDLKLNFNSFPDTIIHLPFHFVYDSTNRNSLNAQINGIQCQYEYLSDKIEGIDGFIVKIPQNINCQDSLNLQIDFKTIEHGEYFSKNQILFNGWCFPMLNYFGENGFNHHYQKHSNYRVNITYPEDFLIATSTLILEQNKQDGQVNIYSESNDIPSFGLVMSRDFLLSETTTGDGIKIQSFYNKSDSKWGEKLLKIAEDVINFYIDTLGFYPQPILTIIPGADKPYGGWPVSPNIVCIHRGIDTKGDYALTHATWITAHEIGHQYWGFNYVLEPLNFPQWFGISMGIYTDWLYCKSRNIKKNYYSFYKSYIKGIKKGYNTTVMQLVDSLNHQGFDWNNVIKHGKSFAILRMLAYEIGEDKFFEIFNECLKSYKGVNVTLDMFQNICESNTNTDLNWFFNQWYLTNDYLDFEVTDIKNLKKGEDFEISFTIQRNGSALASVIDYKLILENGKSLLDSFNGRLFKNDILIITKEPVKEIVLDPKKKHPLINKRNWTMPN